jgi:hypothetical protein
MRVTPWDSSKRQEELEAEELQAIHEAREALGLAEPCGQPRDPRRHCNRDPFKEFDDEMRRLGLL